MRKKRASRSKARGPTLFGPPPILEGEDLAAYNKMFGRAYKAVRPIDFIEEIWVRDIVDATWTLLRLRRIQAAFVSAETSDKIQKAADNEATSLAEAEAQRMKGPEKEEMMAFLQSELEGEQLVAQYPRANEKFQELWESARSNLDMDKIHAKVMLREFGTIERIETLISIAERRIDSVIREIDRHRVICNSLQLVEVDKPKLIEQKTIDKKVA